MTGSPEPLVAHLFREEAGRMVTRLTHALGARHLDVAEDAVQDALLRALHAWPVDGIPEQPAAWLFTVARHRALDRLRRDTWFREREAVITAAVVALGEQGLDEGRLPFGDADLCVMFLTCHPALSREARVALTLKTVCGFGVDEIARAYLQPPADGGAAPRSREADTARHRGRRRNAGSRAISSTDVPPSSRRCT